MSSYRYPWGSMLAAIAGENPGLGEDVRTPEEIAEQRSIGRLVLMEFTGEDFGEDAQQWREWLESHPERIFGPEMSINGIYALYPELRAKRARTSD